MIPVIDAARARFLARIGGALYLYIIVVGATQEAVVRAKVVVPGNALATAENLRSLEWLWRLGVAGEVTLLVSATILSLILYVLLRPVSRDLALLAVLFNVACIAIEGVAAVSLANALSPLSNVYVGTFTPEQAGSLALLSIRAHTAGFSIALIFFGVECVILGYLIHRSGYMPKAIGRLMQLAGVCYAINSFAVLLSPRLSAVLFPAILLPALIAELSLALWLLVRGVRPAQWSAKG
jgi:hypothetical protein